MVRAAIEDQDQLAMKEREKGADGSTRGPEKGTVARHSAFPARVGLYARARIGRVEKL